MCIRVYSTRCTSVRAKDSYSLAPTAKWGLPFILEWSELYEQRPELYEPLIGGWLQETSGRPVKLRVVRLANLRLTAATALQYLKYKEEWPNDRFRLGGYVVRRFDKAESSGWKLNGRSVCQHS